MKLILLHGLGQSPKSWNQTLSVLNETIETVALDLFQLSRTKTYSNLYHRFENAIKRYQEPVHLCGLSLGAVLALNYAIDHKDKVKSLVLIAPQYKMPRLLLKLQNMIFSIMPNSFFKQNGLSKKDFICLTNSMCKLDFQDSIKHILCPTLIICGQKDKANLKAAKALACQMPYAKLYIIENVGHEVNLLAPYPLAKLLNRFYQTI